MLILTLQTLLNTPPEFCLRAINSQWINMCPPEWRRHRTLSSDWLLGDSSIIVIVFSGSKLHFIINLTLHIVFS